MKKSSSFIVVTACLLTLFGCYKSIKPDRPAPINNLPRRHTHEANKREAYDGMRAYHQSELAHKKDAVDIIKTILTVIVIVYAGLAGSALTGKIDSNLAISASWIIAILVGIALSTIVFFTNKKIDEDNQRYRKYQSEYVKEREIIGLEKDLCNAGYISAWVEQQYPNRTGYHHTKNIIRAFAWIVFIVAIVGVGFVYGVHDTSRTKVSESFSR